MLPKMVLKRLLRKWNKGGFSVVFWDGEKVDFGNEPSSFKLIFHKAPSLNLKYNDVILALGEAYMDGFVDFEGSMDDLMRIIALNTQYTCPKGKNAVGIKWDNKVQQQNIHHHYDLGNDFFSLWLDETMSYSCAYFKTHDDSLYQAQLQKIDYILKKISLKPNDKLLDIGCGWGWLIIRAAQQYQVQATGVTLSTEQYEGAKCRIHELGLDELVNVELINYQDLDSQKLQFDKIVSVGMFEHVGRDNLPCYMSKVNELLVPGGTFLLHTITGMFEGLTNSWMEKYIFPGGYVPSLRETIWFLPEYDFHLIHAESLRIHYAKTLDQWYEKFCENKVVIQEKFGERFVRMWGLYLKCCAAAFRVTGLDIYQILFTKGLNNQLPLTYAHLYK